MPVDRFQDALARGQRDVDLAIENKPQFLERIEIQRITDDHLQHTVFLGHRQDGVFPGHALGHELHDRGRDDDLVQIDEVQAVLLGDRPHDLVGRGVTEDDQLIGDLLARGLGDSFGLGQLIGADRTLADENIGEVGFLGGHQRSIVNSCAKYDWGGSLPARQVQL